MAANSSMPAGRDDFATTHWSLVVSAGGDKPAAAAALAELCELYWWPLYAYIRRRIGDVHEAQDATQAFIAHLLERDFVASADRERGRFRAFLLSACKRFLINEWHKARAAKRGGGRRPLSLDFDSGESKLDLLPANALSPEQLYEQQWAIALLERVMEKLRAEYVAKDRLPYFDTLKRFLARSSEGARYAEAARALGISEATAKVAVHRMRRRYRELLRSEISQTIQRPEEVDDEIRHLFVVLGSEKSGGRP
jgi:RNA polymerase sigma-70 factor (ECF subfamily)